MFPGEVTRVIAKFDIEGLYVWHCHILSREDHEMMRPYCVGDLGNCINP
jgi:FtsP/CotA-like multicopper oxidase with cupredoxin domain